MTITGLERQFTPALSRDVFLRPDTSDHQVFADTFTGLYHVPASWMPAPTRVLDLGCNIGLTLAHYRALWPDAHVVGVEPSPDNADLAEMNAPGVTVLRHAVMGETGFGSYDSRARHEAFQVVTGRVLTDDETSEHFVPTRCFTLPETIQQAFGGEDSLPPIVDFAKIDIEGAEWGVLAGGREWAPLVRHLLIELHPSDDFPYGPDARQETDELVAAAGERLYDLGYQFSTQHAGHPRAVWAFR